MNDKSSKVIELFPMDKSALREHLEWLLENEDIIHDLVIGYCAKGEEDPDKRDLYVFWTDKSYMTTLLGIVDIMGRSIADFMVCMAMDDD